MAKSGRVRTRIDLRKMEALRDAAPEIADKTARAIGAAVLEQAIVNIETVNAIDTGALHNSGYLDTFKERRRREGSAAARKRDPNVKLADIAPTQLQNGQARVAFAVEHAAYVEMGTPTMPARPFLIPAADELRKEAPEIVKAILDEELR